MSACGGYIRLCLFACTAAFYLTYTDTYALVVVDYNHASIANVSECNRITYYLICDTLQAETSRSLTEYLSMFLEYSLHVDQYALEVYNTIFCSTIHSNISSKNFSEIIYYFRIEILYFTSYPVQNRKMYYYIFIKKENDLNNTRIYLCNKYKSYLSSYTLKHD